MPFTFFSTSRITVHACNSPIKMVTCSTILVLPVACLSEISLMIFIAAFNVIYCSRSSQYCLWEHRHVMQQVSLPLWSFPSCIKVFLPPCMGFLLLCLLRFHTFFLLNIYPSVLQGYCQAHFRKDLLLTPLCSSVEFPFFQLQIPI